MDRSAPDFKERERKAQRIANEIIGVSRVEFTLSWLFKLSLRSQAATNNPHIAEERGFNVDDSGVNEEDKYVLFTRL